MTYGWQAKLVYDGRFLQERLHLFRRGDDGNGEVIVGWDEQGYPKTEALTPGAMTTFPGFALDGDLAEVIGEAIKPGPSKAELDAYKEWLAVERERVNEFLLRVTPIT